MENKERLRKIIWRIAVVIFAIVIIFLAFYNIKDLKQAKRAEYTLRQLKELRIALEEYYQLANEYPNLTQEGAKDNLRILDYTDKNGKFISFAEIYGRDSLPSTPENENIGESNMIYDTDNFSKRSRTGGWNYDFSGRTGEIHANLPVNIFSQNVDWCEY